MMYFSLTSYNINDKFLELVAVHRDLVVKIASRLRFHEHIREVVRKAGSLAGELLRSTVCRSPEFIVSLFISHISLIITLLFYCLKCGPLG